MPICGCMHLFQLFLVFRLSLYVCVLLVCGCEGKQAPIRIYGSAWTFPGSLEPVNPIRFK